ncbi:hypothetical protein [Methylotuvimicrobium sp. KM1]|uniref:hypothetical protein n=1 Tax=Methylotuvimicrobium sp. KM1 TaxID=3377707 RepID=UPI00384FF17C
MPKKTAKKQKNDENQETRQDLQRRADEFINEGFISGEMDEWSEALNKKFMGYIDAYEDTKWVATFDLLLQCGMTLPNPEELDDTQLSAKLWEVINGLAMLRMFLYSTDHLNDRELYEILWHDVLREEGPVMPLDNDSAFHIDILGSGSETDIELYLRYYADEEERHRWAQDWPEDIMPPHEEPPYDRDRHLPSRDQTQWRIDGKPS